MSSLGAEGFITAEQIERAIGEGRLSNPALAVDVLRLANLDPELYDLVPDANMYAWRIVKAVPGQHVLVAYCPPTSAYTPARIRPPAPGPTSGPESPPETT